MEKYGLDVSEMTEYTQDLVREIKKFPKQARSFLRDEGKKLQKQAKKTARSKVKKKSGNYFKGFKVGKTIYEYGDADFNLLVYNSSPHAHLIEQGHRNRDGSFVAGKYPMRTASEQFEPEYAKDIENELVEYIVRGIEGR